MTMIQLRPNSATPSGVHPNLPLTGAEGSIGVLHQMQYDVACYDATAQAGEWIEDWITSLPGHIASYVYSKLPTFTLPGARASTPCDEIPACKIPEHLQETCCRLKVTYLPEKGKCELTGRCEKTVSENFSLRNTSIRFTPGDTASIVNRNGFLVDLSVPDTVEDAFERIATETGGDVTSWPSSENLTPVMETVFGKILKDSETSEALDVAFVLDTTASMGPYIDQVKVNLVKFLTELQKKKDTRVAILEYRDSDDFLNRVNTPLTKDLQAVKTGVQALTVSGGGDQPEAVLDALVAAKNSLSWDPKAKRVVLLMGDAPPHPKTKDGRYDESAVVAEYAAAATHIAVYPILAK